MKEAVLPLPVREDTIRSRPAMPGGIASICTSVAWV
jgi:hypothetical protein